MIRPRTPADLPALCAALRAVHEADGYPSVWPDDPAGFVAPPGLAAWVAEHRTTGHAGQVAGQVTLRPAEAPLPEWVAVTGLTAAQVGIVSRLFVAPQAQGQGLARALFRAAWAEARRRGLRAILDVRSGAAVPIRLYESEGWERVAALQAPWQDPDGTSPRIYVYRSPA